MLQDAIRTKSFEKAKEIIHSGGNPFEGLQTYHISGIFDTLIKESAFDVIEALIEKGTIAMDIYEYDSFNNTIFMGILKTLAPDADSLVFLNNFIPRVQSLNEELEGKSLLSLAFENEVVITIIKSLVENGCDVNIINRADENLIHQVVKKYVRNYENGLLYLDFLKEQGLDIDKTNISKETPLHIAVKEHRTEYIKWLLDNGADPNLQNKDGVSPFFHAIANAVDLEKYELMRQYALPEFDQRTQAGESILYEAIRMGCSPTLLKLLLEDGADLYQESINYGDSVNAIDVLALTSSDLIQIALDSGQLEVDRQDDQGNTLLHKICSRETLHEEARGKEVYRSIKLLLAAGANANIGNAREETPVMIASNDNMKAKSVELLLNHK